MRSILPWSVVCVALVSLACSRDPVDGPPPPSSGQLAPIAPGAVGARAAGRVAAPTPGPIDVDPDDVDPEMDEEPFPPFVPPAEEDSGVNL